MSQTTVREWFTLKEASEITGRSLNSIRLLVHRKKIADIKKIVENGREQWMIHRSALAALSSAADLKKDDIERCNNCTMKDGEDPSVCEEICGKSAGEIQDVCQSVESDGKKLKDPLDKTVAGEQHAALIMKGHTDPITEVYVASIPLEHYEKKQKEWSDERDRLLQGILVYRYKYEELDKKVKALPAPPEYMKTKIAELEARLKQENDSKHEALCKIESHLTEVIAENQKIRSIYEIQLEDVKNNFKKENEEKSGSIKELEERERELISLVELREKELAEARRPWWKKMFGME